MTTKKDKTEKAAREAREQEAGAADAFQPDDELEADRITDVAQAHIDALAERALRPSQKPAGEDAGVLPDEEPASNFERAQIRPPAVEREPQLLTEADAAADLAGTPRPEREPGPDHTPLPQEEMDALARAADALAERRGLRATVRWAPQLGVAMGFSTKSSDQKYGADGLEGYEMQWSPTPPADWEQVINANLDRYLPTPESLPVGTLVQRHGIEPPFRGTVESWQDDQLTIRCQDGNVVTEHSTGWEPVPGVIQMSGHAELFGDGQVFQAPPEAPAQATAAGAATGVLTVDGPIETAVVPPPSQGEESVARAKTDDADAEELVTYSDPVTRVVTEARIGIAHALVEIAQFNKTGDYSPTLSVATIRLNEVAALVEAFVLEHNAAVAAFVEKLKSGTVTLELTGGDGT